MRVPAFALILGLIVLAAPASAQQGTVTIPSVGPGGVATLGPAIDELWRDCVIVDIAVHQNRVHVRCPLPGPGITWSLHSRNYRPPPRPDVAVEYFAVGTASDPAHADRVLALATSAVQMNRPVTIFYRTNPAENPPGCSPSDCRKLTGLVMLVQ